MQYAPTLTAENGASNKHESAPVGSFVGRIQYAPTLTDENRASNKHVLAPFGSFCGAYSIRPYTGTSKKEDPTTKNAGYVVNVVGINRRHLLPVG